MGLSAQKEAERRDEDGGLKTRNFASLENIFFACILAFLESFPYPALYLLYMARSGSWLCFGVSKFVSSVDFRAAW